MSDFLIDTSIISAFAKPEANEPAIKWLQTVASKSLFVSVMTVGELRLGIEDLPVGKRRSELEQWLEKGLPDGSKRMSCPLLKRLVSDGANDD